MTAETRGSDAAAAGAGEEQLVTIKELKAEGPALAGGATEAEDVVKYWRWKKTGLQIPVPEGNVCWCSQTCLPTCLGPIPSSIQLASAPAAV